MPRANRRSWDWHVALGIAQHSLGLGHSHADIIARLRTEYPDIDIVDISSIVDTAQQSLDAAARWRDAGPRATLSPSDVPLQPGLAPGEYRLGTAVHLPATSSVAARTKFVRVAISATDTHGYQQQQAIDEMQMAADSGLAIDDPSVTAIVHTAAASGILSTSPGHGTPHDVLAEWRSQQISSQPTWDEFEAAVADVISQMQRDYIEGIAESGISVSVRDITRGPTMGGE